MEFKTKLVFMVIIASVALVAVTVTASIVYATHYGTDKHWHSEEATYELVAESLPDSWEAAIREAGRAWDERTDVTITESGTTRNQIDRGPIVGSWSGGGCHPRRSIACVRFGGRIVNGHLVEADIRFNEIYSTGIGTHSLGCFFRRRDVQALVLHEFGHLAGRLDHSTQDYDSVMRPEYDRCIRIPRSHDIQTMNAQYRNHP